MAWSHEFSRAVGLIHLRIVELENAGLEPALLMVPESLKPAEVADGPSQLQLLGVPVLFTHMIDETYICVRAAL